jgi:hypothetical protein
MLVLQTQSGADWKCQWRHLPVRQRMLSVHVPVIRSGPAALWMLTCLKVILTLATESVITVVQNSRCSHACFSAACLEASIKRHLAHLVRSWHWTACGCASLCSRGRPIMFFPPADTDYWGTKQSRYRLLGDPKRPIPIIWGPRARYRLKSTD